jgi:hypothetical protein
MRAHELTRNRGLLGVKLDEPFPVQDVERVLPQAALRACGRLRCLVRFEVGHADMLGSGAEAGKSVSFNSGLNQPK